MLAILCTVHCLPAGAQAATRVHSVRRFLLVFICALRPQPGLPPNMSEKAGPRNSNRTSDKVDAKLKAERDPELSKDQDNVLEPKSRSIHADRGVAEEVRPPS